MARPPQQELDALVPDDETLLSAYSECSEENLEPMKDLIAQVIENTVSLMEEN